MQLLAADIGGTHSRLALARCDGAAPRILRQHDYPSHAHHDLASIITDFLGPGDSPKIAVLAVAGPVHAQGGRQHARLTNLPWQLDNQRLQAQTGIPLICLINDFQALGHSLDQLAADKLDDLQQGQARPRGLRALIGAGTGLGQALMYWRDDHYHVHATEGGHADFAPANELQLALWQNLRQRRSRVSWEDVLSGPGLVRIYRFLQTRHPGQANPRLHQALSQADPAAAITRFALRGDPLARQALDMFSDIYGAQAGNLALSSLPDGGLFIGGGIAPKILKDQRQRQRFLQALRSKGEMSPLLQTLSIKVIRHEHAGLLGALTLAAGLASNRMSV